MHELFPSMGPNAKLLAKDIMRLDVITVPATMDLWKLAQLFSEKGISGAPVINGGKGIIGVVSQADLIRNINALAQTTFAQTAFYENSDPEPAPKRPVLRARDIMSPVVIECDENTPVDELSRIMLKNKVHRIIITRRGRLIGIVTTMDLLRIV